MSRAKEDYYSDQCLQEEFDQTIDENWAEKDTEYLFRICEKGNSNQLNEEI
jgi:hypothetical protein